MNFRSKLRQENPGFQLAPMIDIVFIMLFFLMVSQIFAQWEAEVDITLPTAQTANMPQRLPGEVILNIRSGGEVIVNGQTFSDERLRGLLAQLKQLWKDQPVVLRADESTPYRHVIRVLDLCRQSDVYNVSFATAMPESPPVRP